ncbi:MAG: hypothetical protein JW931_01495 [Methanomicrobiaceae archaeon]|nr:hypothetical protein [Methanomicrobiaceae archaeon]
MTEYNSRVSPGYISSLSDVIEKSLKISRFEDISSPDCRYWTVPAADIQGITRSAKKKAKINRYLVFDTDIDNPPELKNINLIHI